ncbi:ABC transporter permease, partial [Testudinibacter aquarius]
MKNKSISQNFFLIVTILTISIYLSLKTDDFLTIENLYDVINSYSMLAILACGLFIVLISGGIDISFPAITIISQYIMVSFIMKHDANYLVVFLISITSGVSLGLINAVIVNKLKVPSIIITISTLNIFYGLLLYITKGTWLYDY